MSGTGWTLSGHRPVGVVDARNRAPSILAVTSELPWPLDSGGHLRTFHLLRELARSFRVRIVSAVPSGQEPSIESLRQMGMTVCPAKVGPRVAWQEGLRVVGAAARREPYVLYRRHDRSAVRAELERQILMEAPDVFYFDHLDSLIYADLRGQARVVIDLHNVYSMLVQRVSTEQKSWWKGFYLRRESKLLAQMEQRAASVADQLLTVSDDEKLYFDGLGARRVTVVPNGVDCGAFQTLPTGRASEGPVIIYLGSMSWQPNVSAATFLARDVLGRLRDRLPDARLRIVGRSPTAEVKDLAAIPGVEIIGDVPDIRPHLRQAKVMAVPLDSGGGTRLKILEAFAAGLPVVSTPIGCEGLGARHGEHLLIVDRDGFADAIAALLEDDGTAIQLAGRARTLAWKEFDWTIVGRTACATVREIAASGQQSHPARSSF